MLGPLVLDVEVAMPLEGDVEDALLAEAVLGVEGGVVAFNALCADEVVGNVEDLVENPALDGKTLEILEEEVVDTAADMDKVLLDDKLTDAEAVAPAFDTLRRAVVIVLLLPKSFGLWTSPEQ